MTPAQRQRRCDKITAASRDADKAISAAVVAVRTRDHLLEESQGIHPWGRLTYTELADLSGLSRTRVGQIISRIRKTGRS